MSYLDENAVPVLKDLGESTFALPDGYYEEMTVGDAEQLVATQYVEDNVPYQFRTTGGSMDVGNREYLRKLVGGSIAWNQHLENGNFESTSGWASVDLGTATLSASDNIMTVTSVATGSQGFRKTATFTSGHVYLFGIDAKADSAGHMFGAGLNYETMSINNLIPASSTELATSWKRYSGICKFSSSGTSGIRVAITNASSMPTEEKFYVRNAILFDLTQMFGSTIADYLASLSTDSALAKLRAWGFGFMLDGYNAYNSGTMLHTNFSAHKTVGFNQWDEEWEQGLINSDTGENYADTNNIRSKNYIPVIPQTTYYVKCDKTVIIWGYDTDKQPVKRLKYSVGNSTFVTSADNIHFIRFCTNGYGATYQNDICINLSWSGYRDGEYEVYTEHSYPLDSDLVLRGIPKLDASNNLYYDGDTYASDGTVTRKYGIVDLGTLTWDNASAAGTSSCGNPPSNIKLSSTKPIGICNGLIATSYADRTSIDGTIYYSDVSLNVLKSSFGSMTGTQVKSALSGIYLVYELTTPTTESADAYTELQICDDFGTEEFIVTAQSGVSVPVGHETEYMANLRDKLQHLPDLPSSDGSYIVTVADEQMTLTPLPSTFPSTPSEDGTYTLKVTVASGTATMSWTAD